MGSGLSPAIVLNGVACHIQTGAEGETGLLTESYPETGPEHTVTFKCAWFDRIALIQGLLGTVDYDGANILRTPPFAYPLGPNAPAFGLQENRIICTSIGTVTGIKPRTDQDGSLTGVAGWLYYEEAVVPARFTVPAWQPEDVDLDGVLSEATGLAYVATKYRVSGEVFAPPTGAIIWDGGAFAGRPLEDTAASQVRTRLEISCTRIRMPLVPLLTVQNLVGCTNIQDFSISGKKFPKGSVMFMGLNDNEPRGDPANYGLVHDVEMIFLANAGDQSHQKPAALDWNKFMDPNGDWNFVKTADTGDKPFPYFDFSPLFSDAIS
jgi:hypothetical protein